MDSADEEDDRHAAAADDSQLDADDDAMNALLEEEIAAAMQADSDDLEDDRAGTEGEAEERKDDGRAIRGGGGGRGVNGDLLHMGEEQKDSGARKRPLQHVDETKEGELDSDIDEADSKERGPQPLSASASAAHGVSTSVSTVQLSATRKLHNRETYQRREQRRRQAELEQAHIKASLPTKAAVKRYETFRRARLSHSTLKSLIQQCTASNKVEGQLPAVLSAMGRVYVGVIVEEARRAMRAMGHTGNIRPMHLREAHRRLADRGDIIVPNCSDGRKRGIGVAGWQRNGQFFREIG